MEDDEEWTVVVGRRQRREEKRIALLKERRAWEDLPGGVLVNIFRGTEFRFREVTIPQVCRAWKSALDDPQCWSSMIPDSVSPDEAFIKNCDSFPEFPFRRKYYPGFKKIYYPGFKRFRTLIKRSGGGSAITSLYLYPFISSLQINPSRQYHPVVHIDSQVFHLIANRCPNLKHISFHGCGSWFQKDGLSSVREDIIEIFRKCTKLELVDFSYSYGFDCPAIIQEMGNHLPRLRGFRMIGLREYAVTDYIAECLPQLSLLNLIGTSPGEILSWTLSTLLSSCLHLQYLNVAEIGWSHDDYKGIVDEQLIDQATARIPEFFWCDYSLCQHGELAYEVYDQISEPPPLDYHPQVKKRRKKKYSLHQGYEEERDEDEYWYNDPYHAFKGHRRMEAFSRDQGKYKPTNRYEAKQLMSRSQSDDGYKLKLPKWMFD